MVRSRYAKDRAVSWVVSHCLMLSNSRCNSLTASINSASLRKQRSINPGGVLSVRTGCCSTASSSARQMKPAWTYGLSLTIRHNPNYAVPSTTFRMSPYGWHASTYALAGPCEPLSTASNRKRFPPTSTALACSSSATAACCCCCCCCGGGGETTPVSRGAFAQNTALAVCTISLWKMFSFISTKHFHS